MDHCSNSLCGGSEINCFSYSIFAGADFHLALFIIGFSNGYPERNADEVCILEFRTGPLITVIIKNLDALILQIPVQLFSCGGNILIVASKVEQNNLKRCQRKRKNNTMLVMVLFDRCCYDPAYSDTIAAHNKMIFMAFAILIGSVHGLTVCCTQFKYMADLDPLCELKHSIA